MTPETIDLKDYEISGGGKLGESYIKKDNPDILLKLYSTELEKMGLDEYERASKVYQMGLPCPEPGQVVRTADGRVGIQFKRIHGKLSYARALSIHPELIDRYAHEFAQVCKELHATTPPPGLFPNVKDQCLQYVKENPYLTDDERNGLIRLIGTLDDGDTALHGDLHIGNVIFDDQGRKYLIDLSEFCTGSPLFDLGIIFMQACLAPDDMEIELYHITKKTSTAFWHSFVKAYFGPDADIEQIQNQLMPYALLRIICVEKMMGFAVTDIRPAVHAMLGL